MYEQRFNPFAANVEIVKGYFKSGKVLVLGILYLVSLGLSVATALLQPVSATLAQFTELFDQLGIDSSELSSYYSSALSNSTAGTILTILISSITTILTTAAFFIIFAKSRSKDPASSPSGGIGILHVLSVISFVFAIIATVLTVILYVIMIIVLSSSNEYFNGDSQSATVFLVIAGFAVALFLFILISFTASQKNFYRSAKWSLTSVELQTSGAVAYGVYNIIFAVFSGLGLIGSVFTAFSSFNLTSLLSLMSSIISFIILIFTASLALGYNSYIKRYKYGYNDAPYGSAPNDAYVPMGSGDYQPPYGAPSQGDYRDSFTNYNMPQDNSSGYYGSSAHCPNCGAPVNGTSPFCPNCGTKL